MGLAKIERQMAADGKGCLGKAADDEPVFILRAKDKFAPQLVEQWAELVEASLVTDTPHGAYAPVVDPSAGKIKHARALAHTMRAWQELNSCKRPD